jgi:hypothetical protein
MQQTRTLLTDRLRGRSVLLLVGGCPQLLTYASSLRSTGGSQARSGQCWQFVAMNMSQSSRSCHRPPAIAHAMMSWRRSRVSLAKSRTVSLPSSASWTR